MKKTEKKELQLKSVSELQKHLHDGYEILAQLRMDNIQNKLKNTRSMTITRKDIAVILTLIRQKMTEEALKEKEVKEVKST